MKIRPLVASLSCAMLALTFAGTAISADYVVDADAIVKAANWDAMETVTVHFEEDHYSFQELRFKAGTPYKLELKNGASKHHYFTAPEFFKAIATRKAMVNGQAEIKAPYFKAVEVLKEGGQLDLYFVPVKKGSYEVYCTIDDHREKGMEGQIVVE